MTTKKKALRKHLQAIASKGGSVGGRARWQNMPSTDRQLFALESTMKKLAGEPTQLWLASVLYRGHMYAVLGCAVDPEKQFRQARKAFPAGASINWVKAGRMAATRYIKVVKALRENAQMAHWKCRPLIQVAQGLWREQEFEKLTSCKLPRLKGGLMDAWTTPKKPGRPRKTN